MWFELIFGLFLYRFVKRFLYGEDTAVVPDDSHTDALFAVARRLEKLNRGCRVYVGLRIPDPDSASHKSIDLVLVTNRGAVVISVKNISGFVATDKDGNWACSDAKHRKTKQYPNPVTETKQLVCVLEEYLEQRGVVLPEGYLSCKVICPNPIHCVNSDSFPSEVITNHQWTQIQPEQRNSYSGWLKNTLFCGKEKMLESFSGKLNSVLITAPIWDRLEFKGSKCILGKFLEFKGNRDDIEALRKIKRSRVSRLTIEKMGIFFFADSTVQVLCVPRNYQVEEPSWSSHGAEVKVRSSTEIVFLPQNSKQPLKYKLSSVMTLTLSV